MRLYLAQHGEAKSKDEDPERPLADRGVEDVRKVASSVAKFIPSIEEIRHSGILRAKQTAEIFAGHFRPSKLVAVEGIAPLDDVEPMAKLIIKENKDLMLIGHLPFLDKLAAKLLTGDPSTSMIRFKKG